MHAIFKLAFLSAFALSSSSKEKPDVRPDKPDVNENKPDVNADKSNVNAENRKEVERIFDKINAVFDNKQDGLFYFERKEKFYPLLEEIVKSADLYTEAIDLSPELARKFMTMAYEEDKLYPFFARDFYNFVGDHAGSKTAEQLMKAFRYSEETRFGTEFEEVSKAIVGGKDFKKSWRAFAEVAGDILRKHKDKNQLLFQDFLGHWRKDNEEEDTEEEDTEEEEQSWAQRHFNHMRKFKERLDREKKEKEKRMQDFKEELMQQKSTFNAIRLLARAFGDALHEVGITLLEKAKSEI